MATSSLPVHGRKLATINMLHMQYRSASKCVLPVSLTVLHHDLRFDAQLVGHDTVDITAQWTEDWFSASAVNYTIVTSCNHHTSSQIFIYLVMASAK